MIQQYIHLYKTYTKVSFNHTHIIGKSAYCSHSIPFIRNVGMSHYGWQLLTNKSNLLVIFMTCEIYSS
jgi:hypothetical protein